MKPADKKEWEAPACKVFKLLLTAAAASFYMLVGLFVLVLIVKLIRL